MAKPIVDVEDLRAGADDQTDYVETLLRLFLEEADNLLKAIDPHWDDASWRQAMASVMLGAEASAARLIQDHAKAGISLVTGTDDLLMKRLAFLDGLRAAFEATEAKVTEILPSITEGEGGQSDIDLVDSVLPSRNSKARL